VGGGFSRTKKKNGPPGASGQMPARKKQKAAEILRGGFKRGSVHAGKKLRGIREGNKSFQQEEKGRMVKEGCLERKEPVGGVFLVGRGVGWGGDNG